MTTTTIAEPADSGSPKAAPADEERLQPSYILAACSLGAGAIHLMMAPVHAPESAVEAIGFAVVGWFQVVLAALLVFKPRRTWFAVAGIGNAIALVLWAWSRTKGLPVGSNPYEPETAGGVDLSAAALEGAVVVGSLAQLLPKPSFRMPAVASAIGGIAVLVLTSMVLVNPETTNHGHGGESADHPHPAAGAAAGQLAAASVNRCDYSLNPASFWREANLAGTDGSAETAAAAPMAEGHHGGAAGAPATTTTLGPLKGRGSEMIDKLVRLNADGGEAAAGIAVAELATATPEEYDEFLLTMKGSAGHHEASAEETDPSKMTMGHMGPQAWIPMSDAADCDTVRKELEQTKAAIMQFPTAKDAIAAGYRRVAPYVPGIASHWMNFSLVDGKFDINKPEMLLYDGNGEESHLTGASYYVVFDANTQPSQGFTGPNDFYHRHLGLCTSPKGGVIGDSNTTDEECAAGGGRKAAGGSGWMSHAWVVPGCESPWGVFSGINPLLDSQLGKQSGQNEGGCSASAVKARYNLAPGTAANVPTPTTTAPSGNGEEASGQ